MKVLILRIIFLSLLPQTELSEGVQVIIRSIRLYDLVKTAFRFLFQLHHLWSSENYIVRVTSRSRRTKPITKCRNVHCHWLIVLPLPLLPAPTIWFSLDHNEAESEENGNLNAFDSDFWFSLGHKCSLDSAFNYGSDSIASENPSIGPALGSTLLTFHSVVKHSADWAGPVASFWWRTFF